MHKQKHYVANWAYQTNITEENGTVEQEAALMLSTFSDEAFGNASLFNPTHIHVHGGPLQVESNSDTCCADQYKY